jgi:hypothetical protein
VALCIDDGRKKYGRLRRAVKEGEFIGTIEDLTKKHPRITPHVHVEVYKIENGKTSRLNPSDYIQ